MKRSREPEEPLYSPPSPRSPLSDISDPSDPSDAQLPPAKIVSLDPDQKPAATSLSSPGLSSPSPSPHLPASGRDPTADPESTAMACLLHRDRLEFGSYNAYESHYHREHLNRCLECRRNFPSPYYLGLHADECHDPFVAVKRDKGEHTFACFVEGCERKCGSADKRRRHLIDKHAFPKNFFFAITQYGIDGRHSLLDDGGRRYQLHHRRRSSSSVTASKESRRPRSDGGKEGTDRKEGQGAQEALEAQEAQGTDKKERRDGSEALGNAAPRGQRAQTPREAPPTKPHPREQVPPPDERPDVDMDDLAGALSAMTFVPRSVQFGRGGKVGFARR